MDDNEQAISDLIPDCPLAMLPSVYQYRMWHSWFVKEDGCDYEGNFLGWCPLHTDQNDLHVVDTNAVFNFHKGVLRCDGDPSCHHPKRAMSLNNVFNRMMSEHEE